MKQIDQNPAEIPAWFMALHALIKAFEKRSDGQILPAGRAYQNHLDTSEDRERIKEMKSMAFLPSERLWIALAFAVLIGAVLLS